MPVTFAHVMKLEVFFVLKPKLQWSACVYANKAVDVVVNEFILCLFMSTTGTNDGDNIMNVAARRNMVVPHLYYFG